MAANDYGETGVDSLTLPDIVVFHAIARDSQLYYDKRYQSAIAAGALLELVLESRVVFTGNNANEIAIQSSEPFGHSVVDYMLTQLGDTPAPVSVKDWLKRNANDGFYRTAARDALLDRKYVLGDPHKVLGFLKVTRFTAAPKSGIDNLKRELTDILFGASEEVSLRAFATLMLLSERDLFRTNYPDDQLKQHKARIEEICAGRLTAPSPSVEAVKLIKRTIHSIDSSGRNAGGGAG